jgi:acetyltransferase-like isoleucine patch superfamily enzyme
LARGTVSTEVERQAGFQIPIGAWIAADAEVAENATVEPGAVIYPDVWIGAGTRIGAQSVIHSGTRIGEHCTIEEGVVLGKRPRLRAGSSAAGASLDPLVLEAEVTVCCGAVVYAGAYIATRAIIGDQTQVRERSRIGSRSVVGRGSSIDFGASIGARVLIQTGVYVTGGSVVEDDVFLGPGVTTTNDHSMTRHPRGERLEGPTFRRACRVGGGAVLVPGVEVGEEAFVAAGALVTKNVSERAVVMGIPARVTRRVPDEDLIDRWR